MSVFNEIMVTMYLYMMVMLSDIDGTMMYRDQLGTMLVAIILLSSIINFMKFIVTLTLAIK